VELVSASPILIVAYGCLAGVAKQYMAMLILSVYKEMFSLTKCK